MGVRADLLRNGFYHPIQVFKRDQVDKESNLKGNRFYIIGIYILILLKITNDYHTETND